MIAFFVPGVPVPKGSAKAFMRKGMKFPAVIQDNADKQKPWASLVGFTAKEKGVAVEHGPLHIDITFYMPRPKSHYGTGGNAEKLKSSSPSFHTSTPDLDKLVRCVKDSLTGIAWKDDSQVAVLSAAKFYSDNPGASIIIKKVSLD